MVEDRKRRILLISSEGREAVRLSSLLTKSGRAVVHVVDDLYAADGLKDKKYGIDLLVNRLPAIDYEQFPETLQDLADHFPVLLLSEEIPEGLLHRARTEENIRLLHMPLADEQVIDLVTRLADKDMPAQQVHRRFLTDNIAELEVYGSGEISRAFLRNLSKSGAFLEFDKERSDFETGDLLQMTIKLDELKKSRTVNAEVVWTRQRQKNMKCMGINFIQNEDVFDRLLARI